MEHLNPVDQARQLAAEVVKRLGQLNLHRRELERKLHVANGFLPAWKKKITWRFFFFRGEGGYRRTLWEAYRVLQVCQPAAVTGGGTWTGGVEGKSEGDNGDALSKFFNEKFLSEEK